MADLVPLDPLHPTEVLPPEVRKAPRNRLRILQPDEAAAYKAAGTFGFSPSQVDTFRACPRKWAFSAIDRIYTPSGAGAALGGEVHAIWENYLRDGQVPPPGTPAGKIAAATLKYLPLPKIAQVEGETKMWTPLGIMTARIDFFIDDQGRHSRAELGEMPAPWNAEPDAAFAGVPLIGDHKTTSDFGYAKQPEDLVGDGTRDLPGDAQASAYGVVAHVRTGAERIDLFWSYSKTKGARGALPIRARHSLSTLDPALTYLFEDVAQMRHHKETKSSANEVPPNTSACDAFGGCPHRARCKLTAEEQGLAFMTGDLASLLGLAPAPPAPAAQAAPTPAPAPAQAADLGALLGIQAAPAPAPAPTPAPAPAAQAPDLGALLGVQSAPAPTPAPTPAPQPASDGMEETAKKLAARLFADGKALPETAAPAVKAAYAALVAAANPNPPDAPPATVSTPAPKAEPAPAPAPAPAAAAAPSAPAPDASTPAEEPKRPGRPKGSKNKEKGEETSSTPAPTTGDDPVALLESSLSSAVGARRFGLASKIAALLYEVTGESRNATI